ncbi:bZIP transcription factor domain-containing protein [Ditylenchus destructor]|uniref:BZIP transcription factor domain-containing protein n=1 Tax=Ditylenchus destructor TaxID=166010 RepID=A0AAD4N3V1_9BILA|nr:bZIP transcription factor domain-containing protein [Ditylenchus destructor]
MFDLIIHIILLSTDRFIKLLARSFPVILTVEVFVSHTERKQNGLSIVSMNVKNEPYLAALLDESANFSYPIEEIPSSADVPLSWMTPEYCMLQNALHPDYLFHPEVAFEMEVTDDSLTTQSFTTSTEYGINDAHNHEKPRKRSTRKGGRLPKEVDEKHRQSLTKEDIDKLGKRRERNREAAAKCRKRRLEQIAKLEQEIKKLRAESQEYMRMVDQLQRERDHFARQLRQHANCKVFNHRQRNFSQYYSLEPPRLSPMSSALSTSYQTNSYHAGTDSLPESLVSSFRHADGMNCDETENRVVPCLKRQYRKKARNSSVKTVSVIGKQMNRKNNTPDLPLDFEERTKMRRAVRAQQESEEWKELFCQIATT